MNGVQDLAPLKRLLAALEPWLDQVGIVGGWAHQLYRLHPHAQELDYPPLSTLDTDVAVPSKLPAGGGTFDGGCWIRALPRSFSATIARPQLTIVWVATRRASTPSF